MVRKNFRDIIFRIFIALIGCALSPASLFSQQYELNSPLSFVNPFIGTATSDVLTRWGSEGGTYPGAVAPFGSIQLTPETSVADKKGYYYPDSTVYFFSCINHHSGYPNGAAGQLVVMPVRNGDNFKLRQYHRPFHHQDEQATPGYYRVIFNDNNTHIELTAAEHAGIFRFTFPAGVTPILYIGDMGTITPKSNHVFEGQKFNARLEFSTNVMHQQNTDEGLLLTFPVSSTATQIIELKISTSTVSTANAQANIDAELKDQSFDQVKERTQNKWRKQLAVIAIEDDTNDQNKRIFYTALYHSLLLPWIISDVDGTYRDVNGSVHQTSGENEYGGFSPWDTYRTLHPLLTLLYPERQQDMMRSMLDVFNQTEKLPLDPMTGNHAVPIIADSYIKGITGIDRTLAYNAMRKSIDIPPFAQQDLEAYQKDGYLSFSYPESVTRTIEYAYDDWALAQFTQSIMHDDGNYKRLLQRSYQYRNLFHPQQLFLLPRKQHEFKVQPGNFGYKEGDKWVYSYALPHQVRDLINLMGGNNAFATRLDSALTHHQIIFDNETVFHVPYLFNEAAHPELTQKWVREIMASRYANTPGGLPGNDDLGSMSSWYVFSAMGLYPTAPGQPEYDLGSPVFKSLTLHLPAGKEFIIKAKNNSPGNIYTKSLLINGKKFTPLKVSHASIINGGEMIIELDSKPANTYTSHSKVAGSVPQFSIINYAISKKNVKPNEMFWVRYAVSNKGALGTKTTTLYINDKKYTARNSLVGNTIIKDSIGCRRYELGKVRVRIDDLKPMAIDVTDPHLNMGEQLLSSDLQVNPVLKQGAEETISYAVQNIGWRTHTFQVPVYLDSILIMADSIPLNAGEKKEVHKKIKITKNGFHSVQVLRTSDIFKVYGQPATSLVLSLCLQNTGSAHIPDASGFNNHATITRDSDSADAAAAAYIALHKNNFIEIPNARSLDVMGETITMMAWIYPTGDNHNMTDLLTKGDHHVLQLTGNNSLNFFTGGWGRGECAAELPPDWKDHWHHVAGVCDGNTLRVYIDGVLKTTTPLVDHVNLSAPGKWNIGRNEEFPGERIFNGYMDQVHIYAAPLSSEEIASIVHNEMITKK